MKEVVAYVVSSHGYAALPLLFAATAPNAVGGRLYGPKGFKEMRGQPGECRFAPPVYDARAATELWERSEALIGAGACRS